jgi:peptide/nickel transport system substrate-binding protein
LKLRPRRLVTWITCGTLFVLLCLLATSLALFFVARGRVRADEPPRNSIVYGLTLMPSGFDPHINASSELGIVLRSVYDTLLYRDPKTKEFVPGLALRTEISSDGLTYTFRLRTDVHFHDGTPFDAQAVARTLDRVANPETRSQKALFLLGPYDHYTVIDPATIQIVLKKPFAALLDGLSQVYLGIAGPEALRTLDNDRYQFHQVGTGPFKFVEYVPGDHLTLRRNKDYAWGPPFYSPANDRSVDEIVFRFFRDPPTRAPALEAGDAAVMGELSPTDARLFAGNGAIRLVPQAVPGLPTQFVFNTARFPTDDPDIRAALIAATNRAAVVDAIFQQFSPVAYGPLNASTPFYDPAMQTYYPFDVNAAQKILTSKGFKRGEDQKSLVRGDQKLKLVVVIPPWGFHPEIGQKLQSQWRELGIEVELRQVPNLPALIAERDKGEYNLIAYNDSGVDADLLRRFYRSDGGANWTNYKDPELDGWLDLATASIDATERADLYSKIQRRIMDKALLLPIRDTVNLNGARATLGGLGFDAYGWFPLLANVTVEGK